MRGLALWSITQIILVKVMLVILCFCETGTQLSESGTPSLSLELEVISQWTWHVRGPQRTINSKLTPDCLRFKVQGYRLLSNTQIPASHLPLLLMESG